MLFFIFVFISFPFNCYCREIKQIHTLPRKANTLLKDSELDTIMQQINALYHVIQTKNDIDGKEKKIHNEKTVKSRFDKYVPYTTVEADSYAFLKDIHTDDQKGVNGLNDRYYENTKPVNNNRFQTTERISLKGAGYTHDTNICQTYNDNLLKLWSTLSRYVNGDNQSIPDDMALHNIALIVKAYLDHHYVSGETTQVTDEKDLKEMEPVKGINKIPDENDIKLIISDVKKIITIDDNNLVTKIASIILKRVKKFKHGAYLCTKATEDKVINNIDIAYQTFLEDVKCRGAIEGKTLNRSKRNYNSHHILMNMSNPYSSQHINNRKHDNKQENINTQPLSKFLDPEIRDMLQSDSNINTERESRYNEKVRLLKVKTTDSSENTTNELHYSEKDTNKEMKKFLKTPEHDGNPNSEYCQKQAVDKFFDALEVIIKWYTGDIECKSEKNKELHHENYAKLGKTKHHGNSFEEDHSEAFLNEIRLLNYLANTKHDKNLNSDVIRGMLRSISNEKYNKNMSSLDKLNNVKTQSERKQIAKLVNDLKHANHRSHKLDVADQRKISNWLSSWSDVDKRYTPKNKIKDDRNVFDQMIENEPHFLNAKKETDPKAYNLNLYKDKILTKLHKNTDNPKENQNINIFFKPDTFENIKNPEISKFTTTEGDLEDLLNHSYGSLKDLFTTEVTDDFISDVTDKKEFVELTYVVRHPKVIVFQPQFMVKHRIPYENYIKNMDRIFKNTNTINNRKQLVKVLKGLSNGENIVLYQSFNIRKPVEVRDDNDFNLDKDFETMHSEHTLGKHLDNTDMNSGNNATENVLTAEGVISNTSNINLINNEDNDTDYKQYFESESKEIINEFDFPNKQHSTAATFNHKIPTLNGKILWNNYPIYSPKYALNKVLRNKYHNLPLKFTTY